MKRKEHPKGRDVDGESLKRSFLPPPPTHPLENLHDIGRKGFKSEDQGKVTCALSPALSFRVTHSNTHSKGERRTYHRKIHRRTRQQAHTPPAKGQSSNPGSVRPYGEKILCTAPSTPPPPKGVWELLFVGRAHSAETSW
jgi:hypothetical protein